MLLEQPLTRAELAPDSFSRWLAIPLRRMEFFFQFFRCCQLVPQEVGKICPFPDDFLFAAHANDSILTVKEVADIRTVRKMAATKMKKLFWNVVIKHPSSSGSGQVMALKDPSVEKR